MDTELRNKSINTDVQIKNFLQSLIDKKTPLSQRKIAEQLGLSFAMFRHRIVHNNELKVLSDKIIDEARTKSNDINDQIKLILNDYIESEMPVAIEDIAKRAGITIWCCFRRINKIPELNELWKKVKRAPTVTKSDESLNLDAKIILFLNNAVTHNLIVLNENLCKLTGLTAMQIKGRIRNTPTIKELWDKLEHRKYPKKSDKSREKDSIIKDVINQAKQKHIKLSIADIVEQTGFTEMVCKHRISRNPDLKKSWLEVKDPKCKSRSNIMTGEDKRVLVHNIQLFMEDAIKERKPLKMDDIAANCNTTKNIAQHVIYSIPELNNMWNQVEHGRISSNDSQELNSKIEKVLRNAIVHNIPLFIEDIAQELNVTRQTIAGRLTVNSVLKDLWKQTPRKVVLYQPQSSINKTEIIKQAMTDILKENKALTIKELAEQIGMEYESLKNKIKRTPVLKDMWEQMKRKTVCDNSLLIKDNIIKVLKEAIKEKTYMSSSEVAKKAGVTELTFVGRLKRDSELSTLWEQVQKLKAEDINTLNHQIRDVLLESINSGTVLEIEDISNIVHFSKHIVKYRIHHSEELSTLWNKVKNRENKKLQQFHKMKKNDASTEEIMKSLNLDDEKYKDLVTKYNKIKSLLLKRFSDCNPEDVLNWAFLSKREFELGINQIFSRMGYKSKTTRFCVDNGVDIFAQKGGNTTIIECTHNLYSPASTEELLILQANKHYYNADKVIYIATSGVNSNGQKFADKIGTNYQILTLRDIVKLAKKHNVNVDILEEKGNINIIPAPNYGGNWILPQITDSDKISKLRKMNTGEFEKIVIEWLISKGYTVKEANELGINGYYLAINGNHKSLIKCHNQNKIPTIDSIKALYGLKDYYQADDVILAGVPGVTPQSKEFIDKINSKKESKDAYKLIGIDTILS